MENKGMMMMMMMMIKVQS